MSSMVDHKMIVIDGVRYRNEDARRQGLVDGAGKPTGAATAARTAPRRHTGSVAGPDDGKGAGGRTSRTRKTAAGDGAATGDAGGGSGDSGSDATGDAGGGPGDGTS
ncbi:hypothetical protein E1091_00395 [Micromonospora fluostatini]|uniref:Uncharacterized protein n=1 Tax=Micromonospora fluostatini TaxID=1629071 RepID=A0ABY2DMX2_9ACTN|nr:hypothetical protein E1091_00395 [Micromonospora fluostatini]